MKPLKLFSKKPRDLNRPAPEEILSGHIERVCLAAEILTEKLGPVLQQAIGCGDEEIRHWKRSVWLASWFHDWGKANDHFQAMLRKPAHLQPVRHESLSLWIVGYFRSWLQGSLEGLPTWAVSAIFAAVAGHHLKFPDFKDRGGAGYEAELYLGHPDFRETLEIGRKKFGLPKDLFPQGITLNLLSSGNFQKGIGEMEKEYGEPMESLSEDKKTLVAAVKATLIAADLSGSALPRTGWDLGKWILSRLQQTLAAGQLKGIVDKKLKGKPLRPFQAMAEKTEANTVLIEAGCGGGKTAAAYLWASHKAEGRRLFFCYPTTVTATEGFGGYLTEPEFETILLHARVETDYRLLENLPERGEENRELHALKLEALETWPIPVVVCTVDTVLGILENVRRSLFAWPSLLQSVFVFDEVHSLDDRMFSYLLRFLKAFPGLPIMLMTATLPKERRGVLEEICRSRGGLTRINGKGIQEEAPRYRLHRVNRKVAWETAEKSIREGNCKVLWVCNTVSSALKTGEEAWEKGLPVEMFHSRYRYKDRLIRQKAVMEKFRESEEPSLAVTTQVCEMSLDISADLLVTEIAPIPSLIQRLGRLNRFEEEPESPGEALFIEPLKSGPYVADEMELVQEWLEGLCHGKCLSQKDLDRAFQKVCKGVSTPEPAPATALLDGLWRSQAGQRSIREGGYTLEFIREEDRVLGESVANSIPMIPPNKKDWRLWEQEGRFWVAPTGSILYDERRGAQWSKA